MILRTFLAPLILIRQLTHYDSHSLEAVSHPSSSQVIDQATLPFISYLFPMMSHCVSFYYSFLFDLSSDSSCSYCHDHPTTIRSPVRWPHSEYHRDIRSPSDHHRYPSPHPEYSGCTGWSQRRNHMVSRICGEVPCGTTVISGITEGGHMGIIGNI